MQEYACWVQTCATCSVIGVEALQFLGITPVPGQGRGAHAPGPWLSPRRLRFMKSERPLGDDPPKGRGF
jgi:hypothetical protein